MVSPDQIEKRGAEIEGFDADQIVVDDGVGATLPLIEATPDLTTLETSSEAPVNPEKRPKLRLKKVIVISGPSFSGKDSVCKILEQRHGWHIYDGSEDGFTRRKDGSGAPISRTQAEHAAFDERQARKFRDLKPGDEKWLHQTRVGCIILAAEIDERNAALGEQNWELQEGNLPAQMIEQIPAEGFLIHTSDEERLKRAINHEKYKAGIERRRPRSKKAVIAEMREKEADEARSFKKSYGTIQIENNPYSRWLKRNNGNPVYKRVILTDGKTPEEVADEVEEMAIQVGAAEIIQNSQEASGDLTENEELFVSELTDVGEPMTYGPSLSQAPITEIPEDQRIKNA